MGPVRTVQDAPFCLWLLQSLGFELDTREPGDDHTGRLRSPTSGYQYMLLPLNCAVSLGYLRNEAFHPSSMASSTSHLHACCDSGPGIELAKHPRGVQFKRAASICRPKPAIYDGNFSTLAARSEPNHRERSDPPFTKRFGDMVYRGLFLYPVFLPSIVRATA